jgi:Amt family ammonium transporter
VLLFTALWFTFAYLPLAHMVWAGNGFLFGKGALDFAGGTVVHINAGVAGLVGAYMLGPRIGFGRERLSPHSLPLTFTGAALLWVGWFGFNAGSALEAGGVAALAFLNTLVAPAAAVLAWSALETKLRGRASMLGAASGAVSGLVAITPACGTVGIAGAMVIGALGGMAGYWGVNALKRWLRADDSLDVFGIHGVCGIVGAVLTGVFSAPSLGGSGGVDYAVWPQLGVQSLGIAITLAWSGVVALLAFHAARLVFGLRVAHEAEREGLDISSHGESAYDA